MVPYIPPSKRGRRGQVVIAFYAVDLNGLLRDFDISSLRTDDSDSCNSYCFYDAFQQLADIVGIHNDVQEDVKAFNNVFFKKDSKYQKYQTKYYVAEYDDAKSAEEISASMNAYFRKLSTGLAKKRLSNMSEHPLLASFPIDRIVATSLGVGSLQFATFVTKDVLIKTKEEFKDAMKNEFRRKTKAQNDIINTQNEDLKKKTAMIEVLSNKDLKLAKAEKKRLVGNVRRLRQKANASRYVADSVSLALFMRPSDRQPPTHVLTFCSQKQKTCRELVGGGHLNMSLNVSHEDQACKKLYEETFGVALYLPGGINPTFIWHGNEFDTRHQQWYASNYAMVVTVGDGELVESLPNILEEISTDLSIAFENDPLSTLCPSVKGYEWTPVKQFRSVCRPNQKTSWRHLYNAVVKKMIGCPRTRENFR